MSRKAETDSSSLVSDLLRRVRSPEVLAGVAGAAAAARFTKHALEQHTDDEPAAKEDDDLQNEADAENESDDEPQDEVETDDENNEPQAETEDVTEDEADDEPQAEAENEAEDQPQAEAESDDEDEPEVEARNENDEPQDEDETETQTEDTAENGDGPRDEEEATTRSSAANGSMGSDDERMQLLARAREYAEQLTGHPVESFSGLAEEDRGWRVGMEVVEVSRVPASTDVLASYEVIVTGDGELVDFRRAGRYYRNAADGASS